MVVSKLGFSNGISWRFLFDGVLLDACASFAERGLQKDFLIGMVRMPLPNQ
jgi:hypothetical protein